MYLEIRLERKAGLYHQNGIEVSLYLRAAVIITSCLDKLLNLNYAFIPRN